MLEIAEPESGDVPMVDWYRSSLDMKSVWGCVSKINIEEYDNHTSAINDFIVETMYCDAEKEVRKKTESNQIEEKASHSGEFAGGNGAKKVLYIRTGGRNVLTNFREWGKYQDARTKGENKGHSLSVKYREVIGQNKDRANKGH
jgi:hypothetical protein